MSGSRWCLPLLLAACGGEKGGPRVIHGYANVSGTAQQRTILEVNGPGLALFDADGDGDLDLWATNGSLVEVAAAKGPGAGSRLFFNDGAGGFTDRTARSGITPGLWEFGPACGDVDRDGDVDVLVCGLGRDRLWINDGTGRFTEEGALRGLSREGWSSAAAFLDADGDGHLDLYVARYLDFDPASPPPFGGPVRWKGFEVMSGPEGLDPTADLFWRGGAEGRFTAAPITQGMAPLPSFGLGVAAFDLEGDGDTDLYVANDSMPNFLLVNGGTGVFTEEGLVRGVSHGGGGREQAGMGIAVGDADGDGRPDLVVTNFSAEPHTLYMQGERGFRDASFPSGLGGDTLPLLGWGVGLVDLDQDGSLDLLAAHGHVYPVAGQAGTDTAYAQPDRVWLGTGAGAFRALPGGLAGSDEVSRALVWGDVDGDGDLDWITAELHGQLRLHENRMGQGGAVLVRLEGTRSAHDGTGARVSLDGPGGMQWAFPGRSRSFQASVEPRVHFGTGAAEGPFALRVLWPSGIVDEVQVLAGTESTVKEGSGAVSVRPLVQGAVRPARRGSEAPAGHGLRAWEGPEALGGPPPAPSPQPQARSALARSDAAFRAGDYEGVASALHDVLEQDAGFWPARLQRGAALWRLRRYGEAAAEFEIGLESAPGEIARTQFLGHCYLALGKMGPAERAYRATLAANPANLEARRGLGVTLIKLGQVEEGAEALRAVLETPESGGRYRAARVQAAGRLAVLALDTGDAAGALVLADRALGMAPADVEATLVRVRALERLGRHGEAAVWRDRFDRVSALDQQIRAVRDALRREPGDQVNRARLEALGRQLPR